MTTHPDTATRYGLLHYPGDVTADVHEGQLLGHDEAGRFFAVIDAEFDPVKRRTAVHLQHASPDQIRAALGEAQAELAKPRPSFLIFRRAEA
jgi:hypothetical protein